MMLKIRNLKEGEHLEMAVRRHWIIFVMLGFIFLIALILSLSLFAILGFTFIGVMINIAFWLMFSVFLYIKWLNHELDLYIVTNNRIIGVDQISFLNRKVSETILSQVQEVNTNTKGVFANVLNYGTLSIQTAGSQQNLIMEYCPDPTITARKVHNIVDDYRDSQYEKMGKPKETNEDIH